MKLNICYIVDDDLHEFSDFFTNALKKEHTAHQISSTLPIGEIKQQLAKISKLHLVIVLLSTYNKKLLQMLIMTKKKMGFTVLCLSNESEKHPQGIDVIEALPEKTHQLNHLIPLLTYLGTLAFRSQNEALANQAKIKLLTCLSELVHKSENDLDEFTCQFAYALRDMCCANEVVLYMKHAPHYTIDSFDQRKKLNNDTVPDVVTQSRHNKEVKIHFQRENEIKDSNSDSACGEISFPIICNNKAITVLYCVLKQDSLEHITLETISLLESASTQLRIILERIFAQNQLKKQHNVLNEAYQALKETKEQLYQSEKLASIGELAAGLAHEINNPLAYVYNNFDCLEDSVQILLDILSLHSDHITKYKQIKDDVLFDKIKEKHEEAELEFLQEDIVDIFNSSKNGLERIRDIIKNLLSFSRQETSNKVSYDIKQGIDTTLKILNFKLKHDVVVEIDFQHKNQILCIPGLINQVLMNLIVNAIDAANGNPITITIKSWDENSHQYLTVEDNGSGIETQHLNKIFNPFFTTKEVGKGTGLGLSISHNIIAKHDGELSVDSKLNQYTRFTIKLPLDNNA